MTGVRSREYQDESWRTEAACKDEDPRLFDDDRTVGIEERRAKAKEICGRCAVKFACLEAALENGEHGGIWGGLTPRELSALRRTSRSA